jgi:hypothetical protein
MQRVGGALLVALASCSAESSTVSLRGTGRFAATITVPGSAGEASAAHVERVRSALLRRDPAALAEVRGRIDTAGNGQSAVYVLSAEHAPGYHDGAALTDVVRDAQSLLETEARARGVTVSFDETRGERHIDYEFSIGTGAGVTRGRTRTFIVDRLYEVGCMCAGAMCTALASCELPEPPADALPIARDTRR